MRNKMKWFFPIITLLILAPWPVTYVYAHSSDTADQDATQIEITESLEASNTAVIDTIVVPDEVLPSHVYVLNNRDIVTEEAWMEMNSPQNTAVKSTSHNQTASRSATITTSVTVTPSRRIIVDENDRITEIWSNTTGTKRNFYSLRIKEQSLQGPEHPLTQEILAQYNHLLGEVDWTERDQVYSNTTRKGVNL